MPIRALLCIETLMAGTDNNTHTSTDTNTSGDNLFIARVENNKHNPQDDEFSDTPLDDMEVDKVRIKKYHATHSGPFKVYLRSKNGERIKQIGTSKLLFQNFRGGINRVEQVNAFKMRITCKTRDDANMLTTSDKLSDFRVYIPATEVETDGVISLDLEENLHEIVSAGRGVFLNTSFPEVKVLSAFRLSRNETDKDGKPGKSPTTAVRVTFEGTILPHRLVLNGLRIPVRLYRPLEMVCEKCLRTGHTKKYCSSQPKCAKCDAAHLTSECTVTQPRAECSLCKTKHEALRSACPKVKAADERKLKKIKRQQLFSYAQVAKLHSTNPFESLQEDEELSDSCSVDDDVAVGAKRRRILKRRVKETKQTQPTVTQPAQPGPSTSGQSNGQPNRMKTQAQQTKAKESGQKRQNSSGLSASSFEWIRSMALNALKAVAQSMGLSPFAFQATHMIINFVFDHLAPHLWTLLQHYQAFGPQ